MKAPAQPSWLGTRFLLAGAPLLAGIALVMPAGAEAGAPFFRAQGCSVNYRAESISTYSTAKKGDYLRALKNWKFSDAGGTRLKPNVAWRMKRSAGVESKIHQMKYLDRLFGIADERKLPSTPAFSAADRRLALKNAIKLAADWSRAANRGRVPREVAWNPRVAAIRAPYLAYAARRGACTGMISNGDASQIERALKRHVKVLKRKPKESTPQNHKLSIYQGAAMLGSYFPRDPSLRSAAEKAGQRFMRSINGGYNEGEGVWLEHSPRYQRLAYELLDNWVKQIDPDAGTVRRARDKLLATLGRMILPDNQLVTFGDTSGEKIQDGTILGAVRHGWWVARRSGYASYRGPNSWFGLTAQYHTRSHKQSDELSFDLFDRGQHLIQDTGFLHKDRDSMWRYQQSAQAHSTLTVDDRDFDWKLHRPYGSGIREAGGGDGWYAVRATNPLLVAPRKLTAEQRRHSQSFQRDVRRKLAAARRFDARHTRTYLYKPGEALIVADAVRSANVHTYRRRFQFAPKVNAAALFGGVGFLAGNVGGSMVTDSLGAKADLSVKGNSPVFPAAGNRQNRATAIWTTRAKDLDQATGMFYGSSQVKSIAVKGSLASGARIELQGLLGNTLSTVTVSRSGGNLAVNETR